MQLKSLTVAAFILGLGVVAGCDDPEVLDKAESVLLNGAVQAQATCHMASMEAACSSTTVVSATFRATLLQDGAMTFNVVSSLDGRTTRSFDIYRRGDDVKASQLGLGNPDPDEYVQLVQGELLVRGYCGSLSSYQTKTLDLDTDMICTGFNLEAFGITP